MDCTYRNKQEFFADCEWKTMPWSYLNIESLDREIRGLYVFVCRKRNKCIYVGKSLDLKKRLTSHWRRSHNHELRQWIRHFGQMLDIRYRAVRNSTETNLEDLETRLIRSLKPKVNISNN